MIGKFGWDHVFALDLPKITKWKIGLRTLKQCRPGLSKSRVSTPAFVPMPPGPLRMAWSQHDHES